jgi:hypothetical protein
MTTIPAWTIKAPEWTKDVDDAICPKYIPKTQTLLSMYDPNTEIFMIKDMQSGRYINFKVNPNEKWTNTSDVYYTMFDTRGEKTGKDAFFSLKESRDEYLQFLCGEPPWISIVQTTIRKWCSAEQIQYTSKYTAKYNMLEFTNNTNDIRMIVSVQSHESYALDPKIRCIIINRKTGKCDLNFQLAKLDNMKTKIVRYLYSELSCCDKSCEQCHESKLCCTNPYSPCYCSDEQIWKCIFCCWCVPTRI